MEETQAFIAFPMNNLVAVFEDVDSLNMAFEEL